MRSSLGICLAVVTAALAPAPQALAAAPKTACDRTCLDGFVDSVLHAMMQHDPSRAPLAPDVRYTENGEALKPGEGLWRTASAIAIADDGLSTLGRNSSAYRLYFADVPGGQAAYLGALTEDGVPGMMMLRLRVAAGKIIEIETVVVLKASSGADAPSLAPPFNPRGFDEPEPTLLADGERWAPAIMTAAANRYFDGMEKGSSAGVPLGADCSRRVNGVRTTGVPDAPAPDPANPAFRPFALGCAAQLDGGVFRGVARVRRRIVTVDEERGLVMAVAMVDRAAAPAPDPKKAPKRKRGQVPAPPPTLSTELMGVVFKMSEGRITRIEALERSAAIDMPLGWPG